MQRRTSLQFAIKAVALSAVLAAAGSSFAQNSIKLAAIVELSGAGATSGTNFKNGVELAVKEINAAGGIMGKKLELSINDTTTNPGVALALTKKAIDNETFAILALCSPARSS